MPERRVGDEQSPHQGSVGEVQPLPGGRDQPAREEGGELCERPPGGRLPTGEHER